MQTADPAPAGAEIGDVLAMFRGQPTLTRSEVMARTGLSRSTVTQRLDALLAASLVVPAAEGSTPTRGRPANRFAFNADRGVLLVADIGATAVRTAVCNLNGRVLGDREVDCDVTWGPVRVLTLVETLFDELLADSGIGHDLVHGIALDVPGPVDHSSGQVISPPIMTGWDRYDIPGWFRARFDAPVLVDKDVNAMAFGEQRTLYPDVPNLLMVKVGTGVGSGIIAGGQIYRGADGAAGDIGHSHHPSPGGGDGPLCRCGNTGCLEAYAGGWALLRDLGEAGRPVDSVEEVVRLIRSGDAVAVRLARAAGRALGAALADAISLLNPRVLVIGGRLAGAEEQLFAGIREMIYSRSLPLATRHLQIVRSALDRRAGVIGLALMLADTIFAPANIAELIERAGSAPSEPPRKGRAAS